MRRLIAALSLTLVIAPLGGCASLFQEAYDERFEEECDEIRNIDAQRACYNRLEDAQAERRASDDG